jgi:hypothetical protein
MKPLRISCAQLPSVLAIIILFSIVPAYPKDAELDKAVQDVEKSTEKHVQVLTALLAKVPESAKPSIEHAIAVSERGKNVAVEAVELSQTNDPLQKAALHRKHAEKRVVEIQAMQRKGKPEFAETLAADYESSIDEARKEIDKAKSQGKNADKESTALEQSTSRHTQVLTALLNKVPEQARKGITRALEASQRGKHKELGVLKQTQTGKPAVGKPEDASKQQKDRDKQKPTEEAPPQRKGGRAPKGGGAKGRGL